jgi:hypothetical protein
MVAGVSQYVAEVRSHRFPDESHEYKIDPEELAAFADYLDQESLAGKSAWDW